MNKKIVNMLFSDMCCSECKSDFNEDSLFVLRREDNLTVLQITCQNGPDAICYDDVIDAHNFFKNLDEGWEKYIPENLKKNI